MNGRWISWAAFFTFLGLKLTHVIDWSWWWVTAPLWGALLAFFVALVGFGAIFGLAIKGLNKQGKTLKIEETVPRQRRYR